MIQLYFIFVLFISGFLQAQDHSANRVLPWSASFQSQGTEAWRNLNLEKEFPNKAPSLYSQAVALQSENNLICGKNTSFLDMTFPGLQNMKVRTRFHYSQVTRSMNLDIFVSQNGQYEEIVRSSFWIYENENNLGQVKKTSMLDIKNKKSLQMGFINDVFVKSMAKALRPDFSVSKNETDFFEDFLTLLNNSDQGYACCFNSLCREHLKSSRPQPPLDQDSHPQTIRRAQNENPASAI